MAITADDVAAWAKFPGGTPTGDELVLMDRVIAAVIEHVEENYHVADPLTDAQELAVLMQCAALWGRRDTTNGVATFGDLGAFRVSALDPDIRKLLNQKWNFA